MLYPTRVHNLAADHEPESLRGTGLDDMRSGPRGDDLRVAALPEGSGVHPRRAFKEPPGVRQQVLLCDLPRHPTCAAWRVLLLPERESPHPAFEVPARWSRP
jgi:hypothetical protein